MEIKAKFANLKSFLKKEKTEAIKDKIEINPDVFYDAEELKWIESMTEFTGDIHFTNAISEDIPYFYLNRVNGNVVIENCDSGWMLLHLSEITGNLIIKNSDIAWNGDLDKIGGDLIINDSRLMYMNTLSDIDGNLIIKNSDIDGLIGLLNIGENVVLDEARVFGLLRLWNVGKNFKVCDSDICISIPKLRKFAGDKIIKNSTLNQKYVKKYIAKNQKSNENERGM